MTAETLTKIITLAEKHVGNGSAMQSSAILCLDDARVCVGIGDAVSASLRALSSLRYSVGISHTDYREASRLVRAL